MRSTEYDIFDLMEQLVSKSLVTVKHLVGGDVRFGMLESIRQYGRDRLFESGESESLRDRYTDTFVAFAEEAGPHQRQSDMLPWVGRIIAELDNLRAVMVWTLEERPELALRLAGSLIYSEVQWLHPSEAQSWLEPAIKRARELLADESPAVRMRDFIKALIGLGATYGWYGRAADALPLLEEGIALARRYGEDRHLVYAIGIKNGGTIRSLSAERMRELDEAIAIGRKNGFRSELIYPLGSYAGSLIAEGKMDLAMPYLEEALELIRQINNPYMSAVMEAGQGYLAWVQGDLAASKEHTLLALENYEALNMRRSVVTAQSQLAHINRRAGAIDEAEAYYRQSILGWQELGHLSAVAHQIECFAYLAIVREQYDHAATLLGSAQSARKRLNALSVNPIEIQELSEAMDQLATAMGEAKRDQALAAGGLLDLDAAVQIALDEQI